MWPTRCRMRAPCLPAASSGPRDVGNPDGSPGSDGAEHSAAARDDPGARRAVGGPPVQQHRPYPHPQQRQRETAEGESQFARTSRWNRRRRLSACTTGFAHFPPLCTIPARHEVEREIELTPIFVDEDGTESCADGGGTVATTGARTAPRFPPRSVAARIASTAALDLVRQHQWTP